MMKLKFLTFLLTAVAVVLAACGTDDGSREGGGAMDHAEMDPSSAGEVPDDLAEAEDPEYPVDSQAVIKGNRMKGIDGAEATVTGEVETTADSVTDTATTGGGPVEDHKWVIHEEIEDAGDAPFEPGDEVVLEATHMEGMEGATATIDSAEDTTVYMVSY